MLSNISVPRKATALITVAIFIAGCAIVAGAAVAQDQTSLGDAARKVRTEKKSEPASKTFTNENLPKTDAGISVVGPNPSCRSRSFGRARCDRR